MRSLLSQISLHKLEVFCTVAALGSVSRAAERLGIAQPVVSGHLKTLAAKFGEPLTERQGRRVVLTETGRRVHLWAAEIVGRTREIEREMTERRQGVGQARLGASMTLGSYVLPGLIAAFHDTHPGCETSLRVAMPQSILDAIHGGECDFGFTILPPQQERWGLDIAFVREEELILVASDRMSDPGASVDPHALGVIPFVGAQAGTPRRELEDALLAAQGVQRRRIVMEFGHAEALKQAVRAGAGAAFLFRNSVRDELASGALREVATPGMTLRAPVYRVLRRGKRLSPFQSELMEHLSGAMAGAAG
ncbi:LysR family transcriptional regulator [Celeribacter indicus]|uniref:LysR family transcriptional regulator n=1 Tax=Celeribacter indicus TaxID=1208324 RepID=A0A0B5E171_9RHOB|nr:LysR substrate-binding domain-containing protein [Celeribacter indicus]AJE46761.1 LysR family transcriptional regulator [Celeribacter indicus]SDX05787.1 transcriptional regulator, LysR family [Celeribacter indicus]